MFRNTKYIRTFLAGSFFLIIFLSFGLSVFCRADFGQPDGKINSAPYEISINQGNTAACPENMVKSCQQIWISNNGSFRLMTFDKTQFADNRKADQIIFLFEKIRKNHFRHTLSFLLHYRLPAGKDEIPVLS